MSRPHREPLLLLLLAALALVISGWKPYDRTTWLLEVLPVLLGAPILVATYRRYPLTPLLYRRQLTRLAGGADGAWAVAGRSSS